MAQLLQSLGVLLRARLVIHTRAWQDKSSRLDGQSEKASTDAAFRCRLGQMMTMGRRQSRHPKGEQKQSGAFLRLG